MTKKDLSYQEQTNLNEGVFNQMIKTLRPDIWVLMDILDQTGVNPFVVWKVIYQMNNIAMSTKYGKVVVEIENGTVRFVRGESADKVNEPLILPDGPVGIEAKK